jgi:peptidyl-prolyl cis-trans isomerase B (cyclophilin B)
MSYDPYNQQQSQPPGMQPPPPPGMPMAPPAYPQQQTGGVEVNGKAVAALVCGVLFCTGILGIISLVLGKSAEREINAGMGIGRPMAKAGRVLGWVGIAFTLVWVAYFIILFAIIGTAANSISNSTVY